MPIHKVQTPDGGILNIEAPEGASEDDILRFASMNYQQKEEKQPSEQPQSGGIASFKSALHDIAGQGALTLGKTGLMNSEEAQKLYEEHKGKSAGIYKATDEDWLHAPLTKFSELLGGSVPYIAAPIIGGLAAPELIGGSLVGAGLASAGQFVGSNLARQLDEGKKEGKNLADTSLTSAVAASIPQAALDTFSFKMTPLIRGIFGKAGKEITEKTAEEIAKKGILSTITQTGKTANIEGLTEAGQQVLERLQAGLNITDEEARKEYFDSYIGGAVLGGTLGAAGHFIEKSMQNGAESKYDALMKDLRDNFDSASDVPMVDVVQKISDLTGETDLDKIQNFLGGAIDRGHLEASPNEAGDYTVKFKDPTPIEQNDEKQIQSNPDVFKQEVFDSHKDLYNAIVPKLKKFGLEHVGIKIMDSIENGRADGMWANKILHVAMDSPNPVGTMRHESIHALRELGGFKPNEWTTLQNKAKSEWVNTFLKNVKTANNQSLYDAYADQYAKDNGNMDGFDDYIHEEAIAEAFKHFDNTKPPAGLIGNIYHRLKEFFATLRNGFQGNGFHTADSIFRGLDEGTRAPISKEVAQGNAQPAYALKSAPEGIPQNLFDAYGKMAEADEVANGFNYGTTKRNATMASKRFLNAVNKHLIETGQVQPNEDPSGSRAWMDLTSNIASEYRKAKEQKEDTKYSLSNEDSALAKKVEEAKFLEQELEGLVKRISGRIAGMKSEETLEDVAKAVKKLQSYTAQGIQGKDWYEKSAKAVLDAFNGDMILAEKFFQIIAITSANTEVAANFTKTTNAWTQFANNKPIRVGTKDTNQKVNALLNFGEDWGGRKTNTFYLNLMEAMEGKDTGRSTIDLHMTRMIFGTDQPTDAQYELAERLIKSLADKTGLMPRQVQASSWVTQKAKSLFEEFKEAKNKKGIPDNQKMLMAFERALGDYSHQMKARAEALPVTEQLKEPSESIRARTQNITGEVIPSTKIPMGQAEELNYKFKENITKHVLRKGTIQKIAKTLGITSPIRVTLGSGAYKSKVNPNLIVKVINPDMAQSEKDALNLAKAMSYVFKQDATPLFRADKNLVNTDQIGYKYKFEKPLTPTSQKKILAVLQGIFGQEIGFTKIKPDEIVMINYRDGEGNPWLATDLEFKQGLFNANNNIKNILDVISTETFGAKSEYPEHDWIKDENGKELLEGIQGSQGNGLDIQRGLDNISKSFKSTLRNTIRESGATPRFRLRDDVQPTEPAVRPSEGSGEGIVFNARRPDAKSYVGIHYSNGERTHLSGSKYGTGIKGAEGERLKYTKDPRIKSRVYFYIPHSDLNGRYLPPEHGLGTFKHEQQFDNILGPGPEMRRIYTESNANDDFNYFESAVIDAGYDGYANPSMGMMVLLNQNNVPVKFKGNNAKFSVALGKVEPATFLVPDKEPNDTGNLAYMPPASPLSKKPIRLNVGTHDDLTDKGFGANHIIRRVEENPSRKPPEISKELLEDIILQAQKIGRNFTRIYKDYGGYMLLNPLTKEQLIVRERPTHFEIVTMYNARGIPLNVGNPIWSGRNTQPEMPTVSYVGKYLGTPVKAGSGRVEASTKTAITMKKRRVITPEDIQRSIEEENPDKKLAIRAHNTETFKQFFKDSKVVDDEGKPLLLYTGTSKDKDFNSFNVPKNGTWFTTSPEQASAYAFQNDSQGLKDEGYRGWERIYTPTNTASRVIPVFVNIKNPFKMTNEIFQEYVKKEGSYKRAQGILFDILRSKGYDGVDMGDGIWVVLRNPNQIKSAFNPNPTEKKDMRYALRAPETPQFKQWFRDSKIVDDNGKPKVMYHGTARDIHEFRAKQANAIFVTPNPDFAENFSGLSEDYMANEIVNGGGDMPHKLREDLRKEAKRIAKKDKTDYLDEFINLVKQNLPSRQNIMPVFVRAEKPFDYEQYDKDGLIALLNDHPMFANEPELNNYQITAITNGSWDEIESPIVQERIRALGFDSFYVKEGKEKNLAVYEPTQIKSATGNYGNYDINNPDIRYALTKTTKNPSAGQATRQVVNNTIDNIKSDAYWTKLRNEWVDKTSGLARALQGLPQFDNNGKLRADLLIHAKSQAINLIKNGLLTGIPSLNNDGTIGITRSENNLARSMILADKLDEKFKPYGFSGRGGVAEVARILRGEDIIKDDAFANAEGIRLLAKAKADRIDAKKLYKQGKFKDAQNKMRQVAKDRTEGYKLKNQKRELQVNNAHIQWAHDKLNKMPEIEDVLGIWKEVNRGLVDLWVDTGLLDAETAAKFKAKDRYVPLFKSREDLDEEGFFHGAGSTGTKTTGKIHKLKGGESERNIWENVEKHYARMVAQAYENQTRRVGIEQLKHFGLARIVSNTNDDANVRFKEDGKIISAIVENPNDLVAFQAMTYELSPLMKTLVPMTKALRVGALINPMYWIKQLIRDPIHASLVANSGIVTPFHAMTEFAQILMKNSEEAKILAERGVIGAVDSTLSMNEFLNQVGKERKDPNALANALHKIMEVHEASDAATRVAIYKKAYAEGMKRFNDAEKAKDFAVFKARESINFAVHGNSPILQTLRAIIPFFSAAITSLDTVYKAATGYGLNDVERKEAQRMFIARASMMVVLSTVYAMMYQDDDKYKDLPDYIKDNNWLIPTPDGKTFIKIPTPFEIGFLFKTIPEGVVRYMAGTSTGKEVLASYHAGLLQSLPANGIPIPQAGKPILETLTNHSFFTGHPIEGMSDQGLPVAMRGQRASEFSKMLSGFGLDKISLSPAKIDNLIQGYFAELGAFTTELASDIVYKAEGKEPPAKNIENMAFMKSFLTDPNVSKAVQDFYSLEANAKQMSTALNKFKSEGNIEGINSIINDKEKLNSYASEKPLRKVGEQMTKLRKAINFYKENQDIDPEERRRKINELTQIYNDIAKNGYVIADAIGVER